MKRIKNLLIATVLAIVLLAPSYFAFVTAANKITTAPTGYTSSSDFTYNYVDGHLTNWGARGEDCVFLSANSQKFYATSGYGYDEVSAFSGGTTQSNAPQSALYKQLKSLMTKKHTHITNYQETRFLYRYTDCLKNNSDQISSFYSGKTISGTWDSGATWNREHTWPNSKGEGDGENDIMMLRPTSVSENSSRGNKAYGESGGYYDPGVSVRGDCARIMLYVYTRWGNTSYMWGSAGVMENLTVMLRWIQEDPVDTWEMGRNDAVEDITGTRNIFVDYPEYAFLMFGQPIPSTMVTPSGIASSTGACEHNYKVTENKPATEREEGYIKKECTKCGDIVTETLEKLDCTHNYVVIDNKPATETEEGYNKKECTKCGDIVTETLEKLPCQHDFVATIDYIAATETEDGYILRLCGKCNDVIKEILPATGSGSAGGDSSTPNDCEHTLVDIDILQPTETEDGYIYSICTICGETVTTILPATGSQNSSNSSTGAVTPIPASCQGLLGSSTICVSAFALAVVMIFKRKQN